MSINISRNKQCWATDCEEEQKSGFIYCQKHWEESIKGDKEIAKSIPSAKGDNIPQ